MWQWCNRLQTDFNAALSMRAFPAKTNAFHVVFRALAEAVEEVNCGSAG
jgi:hypothetical protein